MHDVPMEDVLNDTNVEPEAPPAASGGFDRRTPIRRGATLSAGMAATGTLVRLGRAQEIRQHPKLSPAHLMTHRPRSSRRQIRSSTGSVTTRRTPRCSIGRTPPSGSAVIVTILGIGITLSGVTSYLN